MEEYSACKKCGNTEIEKITCFDNIMIGCPECGESVDSFEVENPVETWNEEC